MLHCALNRDGTEGHKIKLINHPRQGTQGVQSRVPNKLQLNTITTGNCNSYLNSDLPCTTQWQNIREKGINSKTKIATQEVSKITVNKIP